MRTRPGLLTALSFSAGRGSSCILAMILDGKMPRPNNFIVCSANPGMENKQTLILRDSYRVECEAQDIPFLQVDRNLYQELMGLKASGATRFDLPPFWTKNRETGKKGRLLQMCTEAYKIAPMDKIIREWMHDNLGVSKTSRRIGTGTLIKLIGFSNNEWHRIKEACQKYVQFEYPLIERVMNDEDLTNYFIDNGRQVPPRSVCNACYANDVEYLKAMFETRPDDWLQAVSIDEEIRDLTQVGVTDECYVSSTLLPLRVMAAMDFENLTDQELIRCHSGHCFV